MLTPKRFALIIIALILAFSIAILYLIFKPYELKGEKHVPVRKVRSEALARPIVAGFYHSHYGLRCRSFIQTGQQQHPVNLHLLSQGQSAFSRERR